MSCTLIRHVKIFSTRFHKHWTHAGAVAQRDIHSSLPRQPKWFLLRSLTRNVRSVSNLQAQHTTLINNVPTMGMRQYSYSRTARCWIELIQLLKGEWMCWMNSVITESHYILSSSNSHHASVMSRAYQSADSTCSSTITSTGYMKVGECISFPSGLSYIQTVSGISTVNT